MIQFFYSLNKQESAHKETIFSLHLLLLYSTNNLDGFYSNYELLDERIKNSSSIVAIKKFAQFITMGNYAKAIETVESISFFHLIVLENIQESRKLDTCKIVDLCNNNITINEIQKLFGIQNQNQMDSLVKYANQLFEENKINWKIVGDTVYKKTQNRTCLDANLIIRDMIDLVDQIDKII